VRVFGGAHVEHALKDTLLRMLERFCGVDWQLLEPGRIRTLEGSSLDVEPFQAGDDEATGLVFGDRATGGVVTYVPALAEINDDVVARLAASDVVLVDGTFWCDDELARLGISDRSARDMGHVALSGAGGTLEVLAGLERPRKLLVHINNTNRILLEDSAEREEVIRAGVEIAHDGLEVEL
jgi:pyrroloquinoline quinone biosynthesis protein B